MNLEPISNSLWDRADFMLLFAFFWLIEGLSIRSIDGMCREEEVLLFTVFLFVMGLFLKNDPHFLSRKVFCHLYVCIIFYKTIIMYINKIYCLVPGLQ